MVLTMLCHDCEHLTRDERNMYVCAINSRERPEDCISPKDKNGYYIKIDVCDGCGRIQRKLNKVLTGIYRSRYYAYRYDYICDECAKEKITSRELFKCTGCGIYHPYNARKKAHGDFYCKNCFDEQFIVCDECGELVNRDYAHYTDEAMLCRDCFDNEYVYCNNCDNAVHEDDAFYDGDSDCVYCETCWNDHRTYKDSATQLVDVNRLTVDDSFKTFGVEIEANVNKSYDMRCKELKHFTITEDGSLGGNGVEFISVPMPNPSGLKIIHEFSKKFSNKTLSIDRKCGLHIHYFYHKRLVTASNIKKILLAYMRVENLMFKMMPKSRRGNSYCKSLFEEFSYSGVLAQRTLDDILSYYYGHEISYADREYPREKYNEKRYFWLNLNSILFRNTVEIRLHSGTLSSKKICRWFEINKLLLKWVVSHTLTQVKNLTEEQFLTEIMTPKLTRYIFTRIGECDSSLQLDNMIDMGIYEPMIWNPDVILDLESNKEAIEFEELRELGLEKYIGSE